MSSLIFYTEPDKILVAVDTLATNTDGIPAFFCQKASYIPHLKMIIAGTGAAGIANEWALQASTRMVLTGILNLVHHTTEELQKLWESKKKQLNIPEHITTTVYYFGLSEADNTVKAFAFRSKNQFVPEPIGYGSGVKPACNFRDGVWQDIVPEMMNEQRRLQATLPAHEQVHIGGEIISFTLSIDGCVVQKIGEFDDFKQQEALIFDQFENNS